MTKILLSPPKFHLNLQLCEIIYKRAKFSPDSLGRIPDFATRYPGKLEGILGSISQTYEGELLFPTVLDCAVAYLTKLNIQHPFRDGNKRCSILFTDIFLYLNNVNWTLAHTDAYAIATEIAKQKALGKKLVEIEKLSKTIITNFSEEIHLQEL